MRLQVGQRFICDGTDYRKSSNHLKLKAIHRLRRLSFSGSDWFAAAAAELGSGGITGATFATENFDRLWRAPVERGGADRNSTAPAKLRAGCIFVVTTRARHRTSTVTDGGFSSPEQVEKLYYRNGRRTSHLPQNANDI